MIDKARPQGEIEHVDHGKHAKERAADAVEVNRRDVIASEGIETEGQPNQVAHEAEEGGEVEAEKEADGETDEAADQLEPEHALQLGLHGGARAVVPRHLLTVHEVGAISALSPGTNSCRHWWNLTSLAS